MRRIRATATKERVLMWKNMFSTIIQKWFNSSFVAVSISLLDDDAFSLQI
jgi:hypothetical protein